MDHVGRGRRCGRCTYAGQYTTGLSARFCAGRASANQLALDIGEGDDPNGSDAVFVGFYRDVRGQIHYVPINGHARSLSGKTGQIEQWTGPFDPAALESVHLSAVIPFVRVVVSKMLHGLMHRRDPRERTLLLANPANQLKYARCFRAYRSGDCREEVWRRRRGSMPNLQLYDLLGSVALNSQSNELLKKAQRALTTASVLKLDTIQASNTTIASRAVQISQA